jgi:hypothetical protein
MAPTTREHDPEAMRANNEDHDSDHLSVFRLHSYFKPVRSQATGGRRPTSGSQIFAAVVFVVCTGGFLTAAFYGYGYISDMVHLPYADTSIL